MCCIHLMMLTSIPWGPRVWSWMLCSGRAPPAGTGSHPAYWRRSPAVRQSPSLAVWKYYNRGINITRHGADNKNGGNNFMYS